MARRLWVTVLVALLATLHTPPTHAQQQDTLAELSERVERLERDRERMLETYWRNGLQFEGPGFSGKIGGRIHLDSFYVHSVDRDLRYETAAAGSDEWKSGAGFRRVRLETEGDVAPEGNVPIKYKLQLDFAGPGVAYRDVYMDLKDLPVIGTFRAGHFKEPFGLEELTSSNNITFVERSMAGNTWAPSRDLGVMVTDRAANGMIRWAFGVFRGFERGGEFKATGRVAGSPLYENGGEQVLHLGAAASLRNVDGDTLRYRQRPENSFSARVVDTNWGLDREFGADSEQRFGAEAATVMGPFSLQAEYMLSRVDENDAAIRNDLLFHGGYIYASMFLTPGDRRNYSRSSAAFSGVRPASNLGDKGIGAVELAARLSRIDLTDSEVRGGKATNVTAGVNWYLNPIMRVMVNQVYTDQSKWGDAWTTMVRLQVAF